MADAINAAGNNNINTGYVNWRKLTVEEIIKKEREGEQVPVEVLKWAETINRLSNTPEDITYEAARGETDIDKLNELIYGVPEVGEVQAEEGEEAQNETEAAEEGIFQAEHESENPENEVEDLTLADPTITTDPNEIIKRKERRGLS